MEQNLQEANKRFQQKKREEILKLVPAPLQEDMNKALDLEEKEAFRSVIALCESMLGVESNEQVRILLARVYPKLLREDVEARNQSYQTDVNAFFEFLDGIQMNDLMQEYVVETLIRLCEMMENDWFRPLFAQLVETVEKKGYLKKEIYQKTLASAYASVESYAYFSDHKLSMMAKNALKAGYDRNYTQKDALYENVNRVTTNIDILSYDWYLCQYYPVHKEEFAYIAETYPHSYHLIEDLLLAIDENVAAKEAETLEALLLFTADGITLEQLEETMVKTYAYLMEKENQPQKIFTGGMPYQRDKKIGRNDLCPCGSGKKYKHCCGKS